MKHWLNWQRFNDRQSPTAQSLHHSHGVNQSTQLRRSPRIRYWGFIASILCGSQGLWACHPAMRLITPINQLVIEPSASDPKPTVTNSSPNSGAIGSQIVTIQGRVLRQVPLVQGSVYELQDATGSMWIQTATPIAPADVKARLTLEVQGKPRAVQTAEPTTSTSTTATPNPSQNLTLILVEVDRKTTTK